MQIETFLEQTARRLPDKTALICGQARLTYAKLEAQSNRLTHGLIAEGIERGARVAIYLGNSVEAVLALFAVLKAGAVFVMVNPTTKDQKLAHLLDDSQAQAVILPERRRAALEDTLAGRPHLKTVIATGRGACEPSLEGLIERNTTDKPPAKRAIEIDLAGLLYTSGSTGVPKGVMATHQNVNAAAESIITYLENTEDDVILSVLPISFGYGLYQILMSARFGGTVVLEPSFAYPHAVLEKLTEHGVTGFPFVPTMASMLLQMDLGEYNLRGLRYLTSAGAALPVEHIERLRGLLPDVRLYVMYGLTECARASYLPPEELDRRPGSVGRGIPNQEWAIVDADGHRIGPGVTGELVIRGPHVMQGYWNMPEATAAVLRPGPFDDPRPVLFTGDLFTADEDGFLTFAGRKDDIIKSRGEKVSPREVEEVLHRHPDVAEAAVVGVPDEVLGQAVAAFVVPKPGTLPTERELLRHCAAHLEDFAIPQRMELRESLPKSDNGKIQKRVLQGAQP
ncbi:MAG: AMP-binding protein [Pirellulales bacterium]|nr:AMP-binding protein [Pirellulales bacterium]